MRGRRKYNRSRSNAKHYAQNVYIHNPRNNKKRRPTKRRPHPKKVVQRRLNKKKVAITIFIFIVIIISIVKALKKDEIIETISKNEVKNIGELNKNEEIQTNQEMINSQNVKKEITDWQLVLVNYENILPQDFEVEVADIDDMRQFDARAIKYLKQMLNDMRKDGISNVWVQSAYRSVERQNELYEESIQKYIKQGKSQEEAERLTNEYINKPGTSEHNLGLAVDFNSVDNKFDDLDGFKWLQKNAEDYGFILRYRKDKEDITKIKYESWHWRYVGEEHAKKINQLDMCLEEYIEYLQNIE